MKDSLVYLSASDVLCSDGSAEEKVKTILIISSILHDVPAADQPQQQQSAAASDGRDKEKKKKKKKTTAT